jgi:hypothetical protein
VKWFCAGAAVLAGLFAASMASAQDLIETPPLAPDVAGLPRLAGDGAIAAEVNAQLQELDERDLDAINCSGESPARNPSRTVEVLSNGPDFLSIFISKGTYCEGTAHPWRVQTIVNFDLRTGNRTDLREFMPQSFVQADQDGDPMAIMYLNEVEDFTSNCVLAFARELQVGGLDLHLGLVESENALMLLLRGLSSYVDTPCLNAAYVPLARLEEAGFDERLLRALSQP